MPPIFINTNNSDKKHRIYVGDKAGSAAVPAEDKIKEMVIKIIANEATFTTNNITDPKGYTLFFEVSEFSGSGGSVDCKITGEILRYPSSATKGHGAKAEKVMVSGEWSGKAQVSGRDALAQAIEAIMEKIVPKSFAVMTADMARR